MLLCTCNANCPEIIQRLMDENRELRVRIEMMERKLNDKPRNQ